MREKRKNPPHVGVVLPLVKFRLYPRYIKKIAKKRRTESRCCGPTSLYTPRRGGVVGLRLIHTPEAFERIARHRPRYSTAHYLQFSWSTNKHTHTHLPHARGSFSFAQPGDARGPTTSQIQAPCFSAQMNDALRPTLLIPPFPCVCVCCCCCCCISPLPLFTHSAPGKHVGVRWHCSDGGVGGRPASRCVCRGHGTARCRSSSPCAVCADRDRQTRRVPSHPEPLEPGEVECSHQDDEHAAAADMQRLPADSPALPLHKRPGCVQ